MERLQDADVNPSRSLIVWLNEAEHLKLMFRKDGAEDFGQTYRSFVRAVGKLDEEKRFVRDNRLGFITFDVASIGTGLRSVSQSVSQSVIKLISFEQFETIRLP